MTNIHGSTLAFPISVDERGTLRTISDPVEMAEQYLRDLIETRTGERTMLPNYGMSDRIFAVKGAGFTAQLAAELEEKVRDYIPLIDSITVTVGELAEGRFSPGFALDQHRAAIEVQFTVQGSNTPRNLVFPTWQYIGQSEEL